MATETPAPVAPAPTKISRVLLIKALAAGGDAFRAGKTIADCPHVGGADLADRMQVHYWCKGFNAAGRAA